MLSFTVMFRNRNTGKLKAITIEAEHVKAAETRAARSLPMKDKMEHMHTSPGKLIKEKKKK